MPIYEFHCEKCDADFEQLFRSMDAAAVGTVRCPECGGKKTRRKLSLFGMSVASSRGEARPSRSGCSSCSRSSCTGCHR